MKNIISKNKKITIIIAIIFIVIISVLLINNFEKIMIIVNYPIKNLDMIILEITKNHLNTLLVF